MASTGVVTLTGTIQNAPTGTRTFGPLTITLSAAVDATQVLSLSSGNNTVTVPTGATVCIITGPNATNPVPNPPSSATLTLKGVSGDTGVSISNKYPTMLVWDTAPSTFVINASTTATVEILFA